MQRGMVERVCDNRMGETRDCSQRACPAWGMKSLTPEFTQKGGNSALHVGQG